MDIGRGCCHLLPGTLVYYEDGFGYLCPDCYEFISGRYHYIYQLLTRVRRRRFDRNLKNGMQIFYSYSELLQTRLESLKETHPLEFYAFLWWCERHYPDYTWDAIATWNEIKLSAVWDIIAVLFCKIPLELRPWKFAECHEFLNQMERSRL